MGLGALLLGVLALQVRWGLAPLRRMNANLRDVEQGRAEQLDTRLPDELAMLAESMNAVLIRDQRLIERSRHTAGNLAHALKTPLSVMRLLVKQLPSESRAHWEVELTRIDNAVRHHFSAGIGCWRGGAFRPNCRTGYVGGADYWAYTSGAAPSYSPAATHDSVRARPYGWAGSSGNRR